MVDVNEDGTIAYEEFAPLYYGWMFECFKVRGSLIRALPPFVRAQSQRTHLLIQFGALNAAASRISRCRCQTDAIALERAFGR